MPLISWSDKFAIGLEMIDEQHRMLFKLVNDLHAHINDSAGQQALSDALGALIDYTTYHFREEEDYMFNIEYPKFGQHKLLHDTLTQQVLDFQQGFSEGKGNAAEFLEFLYKWLTIHIMEHDKKIGKFMNMKILRPIM